MRAAGWAAAGLVLLHAEAWGGPPLPTAPPEYYVHLETFAPGTAPLDVSGRVQHARPDSLDLVRRLPAAGRMPRVEASIAAEQVILHPYDAAGTRYRAAMPRGAPLAWSYAWDQSDDESLPQALGPGWICLWLGGVVLEPRVPAPVDTTAVVRILLGLNAGPNSRALAPWPAQGGLHRPASAADLADAFVALGAWQVQEHVTAACTVTVAFAPLRAAHAAAWAPDLADAAARAAAPSSRALVCVVPGKRAQVWRAGRTWLVRSPEDASAPPTLATAAHAADARPARATPRAGGR